MGVREVPMTSNPLKGVNSAPAKPRDRLMDKVNAILAAYVPAAPLEPYLSHRICLTGA